MVIAVFIDMNRAFETLDREILVQIVSSLGIRGTVLAWLRSWLQGRTQFTKYKNTTSTSRPVNIGVPQGTPLSCLMFIVYIDLIVRVVKKCRIKLFADDILLWVCASSLAEALACIEEDLRSIECFLKMIRLKINAHKTKLMALGCDDEINLTIDGIMVEQVHEMKYLGVIIDEKLNFKAYAAYVRKKMASKIDMLRRLRKKFDIDTALMFYNSLIAPHVDYCSSCLFLVPRAELLMIQRMQNRALRIILRKPIDTIIQQMLDEAN